MTRKDFEGALIISPPSVAGSSWLKKLEPCSIANASGWMKIRAFNKRRQSFDAGFALSDHADWNELNAAAIGTGAEEIFVTHGFCSAFARWLRHNGLNANELYSEYKTKLQ